MTKGRSCRNACLESCKGQDFDINLALGQVSEVVEVTGNAANESATCR